MNECKFSVETLSGLERKVIVSVPAEKVEKEVSSRLKSLAQKVKMDGFRPGKVPLDVVKNVIPTVCSKK